MPLLLRSSYAPVFIDYGNLLMYMPQIEIHRNFVDHSMQFCSILFRSPLFFYFVCDSNNIQTWKTSKTTKKMG